VFRQAELAQAGRWLGPIGSRLVAELVIGILYSDKSSYILDKTPFKPHPALPPTGTFTMGQLAAAQSTSSSTSLAPPSRALRIEPRPRGCTGCV
jgi:hypothetical protein